MRAGRQCAQRARVRTRHPCHRDRAHLPLGPQWSHSMCMLLPMTSLPSMPLHVTTALLGCSRGAGRGIGGTPKCVANRWTTSTRGSRCATSSSRCSTDTWSASSSTARSSRRSWRPPPHPAPPSHSMYPVRRADNGRTRFENVGTGAAALPGSSFARGCGPCVVGWQSAMHATVHV